MCAGVGAEMPEFDYSTRVSSNEPGSVMWPATKQF